MQSIPEIATQIVNKSLAEADKDSTSRTIILVGSKSVGKSTVLYSFLDKNDTPRETLVLEYSFGRKSLQKQSLEKTICHVWEYGGKLDMLKMVLTSIPVCRKFYYCIMVDICKIKKIWPTLETCIEAMNETYTDPVKRPELIILCGKYDLFKNYDSEIKKIICTTLRSVALLYNAHLLFYSSKESQLIKRAKDMFYGIGFGSGLPTKEKSTNFTKPLVIPKGTDSWESIGVPPTTIDQVKVNHVNKIPSDPDLPAETEVPQKSHPEPVLDSLATLKYEALSRQLAMFP